MSFVVVRVLKVGLPVFWFNIFLEWTVHNMFVYLCMI
jgi:hypothetical protein